ncbi:E3 ubiquitin-protein ligase TRIM32 [Frankliniella fusca]|uniref:E3 ubiquitin-protein ligase TRIM32 n=1 Tax=Frankliniella fusca TaxID=407009 RepID=A0AAE1HRP0_9NEOP|nr:E3 ubiquitin-protein ligase TRIM32 [Frankliniella fusca]
MDCEICLEDLDQREHAPKVVPCGHTVCLQCLQRAVKSECPICRTSFAVSPESLPNNFSLLRVVDRHGDSSRRSRRSAREWCFDCRAAATRRCWEEHEMVGTRTALRSLLEGSLPQAARQLEGLPGQLQEQQTLLALALVDGDARWDVTLRDGSRLVSGTLPKAKDPLTKALLLMLAARLVPDEDQLSLRSAATPVPTDMPVELSQPEGQGPAARGLSTAPNSNPDNRQPRFSKWGVLLNASGKSKGPLRESQRRVRTPVAQDTSLAEQYDQVLSHLHDAPPSPTLPLREELEVATICCSLPNDRKPEKARALRAAKGVRRLVGVVCSRCWDPDWSLQLLQSAAPTVEELHVSHPGAEHLLAVSGALRLRRLQVWCAPDLWGPGAGPLGAPVLPPAARAASGLRWLTAVGLPRVTLRSLLQAHGHALAVLQLLVGTEGPSAWPMACADLPALLDQCDLRALGRLVLRRRGCCHERPACLEQLSALRRLLPRGADVLCEACDRVEFDKF